MAKLSDIIEMMGSLCGKGQRFENKNQMADFLGLEREDKPGFYKILDGKTRPRADRLLDWMERLGFSLCPPWERQDGLRQLEADENRLRAEISGEVNKIMAEHGFDRDSRGLVTDTIQKIEAKTEQPSHRQAAGE